MCCKVFSDTCQRLVEAQQHIAQLEEELAHSREAKHDKAFQRVFFFFLSPI